MKGKFYGIGVGPGNPELLTLRAYKILKDIDVLCTPKAKTEGDSLALSIVNQAVVRDFTLLELLFPMSKDEQVLQEHWDRAAQQVLDILNQGKSVAFITIGDPMFYSTYAYILKRIIKDPAIEVETIPGITAFSACTSFLNQPLAEAEEKIAVIPAAYDLGHIKDTLERFENVVMMKVNKAFDQIIDVLRELNLLDKGVFISRCGYPDQFYTRDLESLVGQPRDYMSILIVKKAGWEGLK
ncbi:MAG: precorrin-2 C(20)-methyltransferase [Thermincolia bacterium]